jgi:N-acetylglucosamine malate deacetylase 1
VAVTRRNLLIGASGVASGLVFGLPAMEAIAQPASPKRTLKFIVTGGHPGDPEYGCGGTVARLTQLGHEVVLLYLNDGAWPPTPFPTRVAEAKRACEILKARPAYAGQTNGHAVVDNAHYEAYAQIVSAEKPDAIFTQWPIDNHRDHRAIAMLTYAAWRQSKKAFTLYYYEVSDGEDPSVLPATPMPVRRLTGIMRYRIRSPPFEVSKVAIKELRHLFSSCKALRILFRSWG